MVTTTFEIMNLIDCALNNVFLKKLFPQGISEKAYIAHLGLNPDADFSLHIHTKQKPAIEPPKWGIWSKNYDTIVIDLTGTQIDIIELRGWKNISYEKLTLSECENKYHLASGGTDWAVKLAFTSLIFQQCRTYKEA